MNPSFWAGRRVLVTGHTGFKGSWLSLMLETMGADVTGYALEAPTRPSLFELAGIAERIKSIVGDIRDLAALSRVVDNAAPEIVIHMAAQSVVLLSYDEPVSTYSTNVIGTVHLLEAVRGCRRPCTVINVTTDKCYENRNWPWGYRETDTLGGHDPYSNSKACAELVGQAYRDSYFPPARWQEHRVGIASARAGNVIGGGDWTPRQLVPEAMAALSQGRPVVLRHPNAVRPWQHVLDCLSGYLTLAKSLSGDGQAFSGPWNFGPSDSDTRTVAEVVETLAGRWNVARAWEADTREHAAEEHLLRLDVSKTSSVLDWRPRLSIETALHWVAEWYGSYHAGGSPLELCRRQIQNYLRSEAGTATP